MSRHGVAHTERRQRKVGCISEECVRTIVVLRQDRSNFDNRQACRCYRREIRLQVEVILNLEIHVPVVTLHAASGCANRVVVGGSGTGKAEHTSDGNECRPNELSDPPIIHLYLSCCLPAIATGSGARGLL